MRRTPSQGAAVMTWHLTFILPAALCGLGGLVCANEAALNMRLGENGHAISNSAAAIVCWIGAAIALAGAVLS